MSGKTIRNTNISGLKESLENSMLRKKPQKSFSNDKKEKIMIIQSLSKIIYLNSIKAQLNVGSNILLTTMPIHPCRSDLKTWMHAKNRRTKLIRVLRVVKK